MKNMSVNRNPPGGAFAKGGNTSMHKFSGTGTQEPGQSAQEGSGSRRGIEPKAGPSNVMGYSENEAKNSFGAGPAEPGQSASSGKRQDGFAKGGNTSMHGNTGSRQAVPGQSSQQ